MRYGNNFAIYHSRAPGYLGTADWRAAAFFLTNCITYIFEIGITLQ
jgi:hypothetical protein